MSSAPLLDHVSVAIAAATILALRLSTSTTVLANTPQTTIESRLAKHKKDEPHPPGNNI
jgi:hypothetical protein